MLGRRTSRPIRLLLACSVLALLPGLAAASFEGELVLTVSWQSSFCETRPQRPECRSQTPARFDAEHFTLHGLWPQPRGNTYCGLSEAEQDEMRARRWSRLPAVPLSAETRRALDRAMPGTQSNLQRHQWMKHGTCYAAEPETYFRHALMLLAELNGSEVQRLFAESIGERITAEEVRRRFDAAFGPAAGDRVVVRCRDDGGRRLITELQIHLRGPLDDASSLGERMAAAGARGAGCRGGIVDPVGLQ